MDSTSPPTLRSRLLQMFAGLVAASLLYVLSAGPAFYLLVRINGKWVEGWGTFYTPALVVLQLAKPGLADAYCGWWGQLAERHMGHPGH